MLLTIDQFAGRQRGIACDFDGRVGRLPDRPVGARGLQVTAGADVAQRQAAHTVDQRDVGAIGVDRAVEVIGLVQRDVIAGLEVGRASDHRQRAARLVDGPVGGGQVQRCRADRAVKRQVVLGCDLEITAGLHIAKLQAVDIVERDVLTIGVDRATEVVAGAVQGDVPALLLTVDQFAGRQRGIACDLDDGVGRLPDRPVGARGLQVTAGADVAQRQTTHTVDQRDIVPTATVGLAEGHRPLEIIARPGQHRVLQGSGISDELRSAFDHEIARLRHAPERTSACGGADKITVDRGAAVDDLAGGREQIACRTRHNAADCERTAGDQCR